LRFPSLQSSETMNSLLIPRRRRKRQPGGVAHLGKGWFRDLGIAFATVCLLTLALLERYAIDRLPCRWGALSGVTTSMISSVARRQSFRKPLHPWDGRPLPRALRLNYAPSLLDRAHPLALLKQYIPLAEFYRFPHPRNFTGECSCLNPNSTLECCSRTFRRSHKMGCVMSMNLLEQYPGQYRLAAEPKFFTYNLGLPETDYRDVIVLRDLYSSILSGYLYHAKVSCFYLS